MQYGDLDFEMLVNMRRQHQTKQATTGVRTKKFKTDSSHETTMRGKIIRELHEVLKEVQDDVAIGTGADRGRRWTDNRAPAPGNAANAALAAATVAKKVSTFFMILHSVF
jgi:hypothetical protein